MILAKYFAEENLPESEQKMLVEIFDHKDNRKLIDSLDEIFRSFPLNNLCAKHSFTRLINRIEND